MRADNELLDMIGFAHKVYGSGRKWVRKPSDDVLWRNPAGERAAFGELEQAIEDTRAEMRKAIEEFREFATVNTIQWESILPNEPAHKERLAVAVDRGACLRASLRSMGAAYATAYTNLVGNLDSFMKGFSGIFKDLGDDSQDNYELA